MLSDAICLVPVLSPSPSRSIHFGDVSETTDGNLLQTAQRSFDFDGRVAVKLTVTALLNNNVKVFFFKDGASFCYCARLRVVPNFSQVERVEISSHFHALRAPARSI